MCHFRAGSLPWAGSGAWAELFRAAGSAAAAVWLGHSEGYSTMAPQYIGGRYYATMYGSDAPAPLWKTYRDAALADTPALFC